MISKSIPAISIDSLRQDSGKVSLSVGDTGTTPSHPYTCTFTNISTCIAQSRLFCMGHGVEREAKPRAKGLKKRRPLTTMDF